MTDLPDRDDVFWMEEAEDKGMDIVGQMLEIFEALRGMTHVEPTAVVDGDVVNKQRVPRRCCKAPVRSDPPCKTSTGRVSIGEIMHPR